MDTVLVPSLEDLDNPLIKDEFIGASDIGLKWPLCVVFGEDFDQNTDSCEFDNNFDYQDPFSNYSQLIQRQDSLSFFSSDVHSDYQQQKLVEQQDQRQLIISNNDSYQRESIQFCGVDSIDYQQQKLVEQQNQRQLIISNNDSYQRESIQFCGIDSIDYSWLESSMDLNFNMDQEQILDEIIRECREFECRPESIRNGHFSYSPLSPISPANSSSSSTSSWCEKSSAMSIMRKGVIRKQSKKQIKTTTAKQERKKEQNRRAAVRYREKKRLQSAAIMEEMKQLEKRHQELVNKSTILQREITVLKSLMVHVGMTK